MTARGFLFHKHVYLISQIKNGIAYCQYCNKPYPGYV